MPGQHRDDVIVQLVEVEGFLVATQPPGVGLVEQVLQLDVGVGHRCHVVEQRQKPLTDAGRTGIQSSITGSLTRQSCAETVSRGLNTDPNDLW